MNEKTSREGEPEITFGFAFMAFCIWLWNLRITFPNEDILLATVDISSCFRFPRIFADLVGAFGFLIGPWYFAANAMVFGSIISANSWEPFRRAIAGIAIASFTIQHLPEKHKQWLSLISWDPPAPAGTHFVQASACNKNRGIIDKDGNERPSEHNIYVDDDLIADIRRRLPYALAAVIEAIFTVMGLPMTRMRQVAVSVEKLSELVVSHKLVLLGFQFNSRRMTVGLTDKYR